MSHYFPNHPTPFPQEPGGDFRYQAPGYPFPGTGVPTPAPGAFPGYVPAPAPPPQPNAPGFVSAAQATAQAAQAAATEAAVNDFLTQNSNRNAGNFIENILNYNNGKLVKIHMTFNSGGNAGESRTFTGILEAAGRDHIILSDPKTQHRYVLLMIYFDYAEFPDEINYYYPGTNRLNVADPDFLTNNPEVLPLYNYKAEKQNAFIQHLEQKVSQFAPPQP